MNKELLKQAKEALESIDVGYRTRNGNPKEVSFDEAKVDAALAAINAALSQPVQPATSEVTDAEIDKILNCIKITSGVNGVFVGYEAGELRRALKTFFSNRAYAEDRAIVDRALDEIRAAIASQKAQS